MTETRHAIVAGLGLAAVVFGSLLFALAAGGDSDDSTLRLFGGSLGAGLLASGIGLVIAAAATYLRKDG